MTPVEQEGGYKLAPPENWNEEALGPCGCLSIIIKDGAFVSRWEPTEVERAQISAGALVNLWVLSERHPVVGLSVGNEDAVT